MLRRPPRARCGKQRPGQYGAGRGRGSESAISRLHRRAKTLAREGRISTEEGCSEREAASLPGSSALGLKRSQAQQGQPVRMALAGHQLARALALALGVPAAHEAAVVQEEAQQVQVRAAEVTAQGEVGAQPRVDVGSVKNLGHYAASGIAWWPKRPSSTAALT